MSAQTCKSCKHFHQHYGLRDGTLFRVYYGHCTLKTGRAVAKRPYSKACWDFTPGEDDTEGFVRKDYLSKKLLQYMTELELLPEDIGWDKDA